MLTNEEDALIDYLEAHYGCHSFILYGSRAVGTAAPNSDWDVLALNNGSTIQWCHKQVEDVGEMNAYIYPESFAQYHPKSPSPLFLPKDHFIRLRHGRVLIEQSGLCSALIRLANEIYTQGPGPKPPGYTEHMQYQFYGLWLRRMRDENVSKELQNIYRARLLNHAIDVYFRLRERWIPAEQDIFSYLATHDPKAHIALRAALKPAASEVEITDWLGCVFAID